MIRGEEFFINKSRIRALEAALLGVRVPETSLPINYGLLWEFVYAVVAKIDTFTESEIRHAVATVEPPTLDYWWSYRYEKAKVVDALNRLDEVAVELYLKEVFGEFPFNACTGVPDVEDRLAFGALHLAWARLREVVGVEVVNFFISELEQEAGVSA